MTWSVVFSAAAEADLIAIYDYIAQRGGADVALRFVERIEAYCLDFSAMPEHGTRRDDLRARVAHRWVRRRAICSRSIRKPTAS